MTRSVIYIISTFLTIIIVCGCKKNEDPVPTDLFVGTYDLELVIEEYDASEFNSEEESFLAPESFEISKSELFNPITGEMVSSYRFLIGEVFLGLTEQNSDGTVLVGTQECPNEDDLRAVSITFQEDSLYRLNMRNCITREVIADYNKTVIE